MLPAINFSLLLNIVLLIVLLIVFAVRFRWIELERWVEQFNPHEGWYIQAIELRIARRRVWSTRVTRQMEEYDHTEES